MLNLSFLTTFTTFTWHHPLCPYPLCHHCFDREDHQPRLRASIQDVVCETLANLAAHAEARPLVLNLAAGVDALRVLVCMLPRWCAMRRTKALEMTVKAVCMFGHDRPGLVAQAGGLAAMLLLVRAGVSSAGYRVLQWVSSSACPAHLLFSMLAFSPVRWLT
jgi:hypothetical protein